MLPEAVTCRRWRREASEVGQAAIDFLEHGGKEVVVTSLSNLAQAVAAQGGTHITRGISS